MLKKLMLPVLAMVLASPAVYAGGEGWVTDFEAAKAQAAEEGKDLLLDFTGSDWCGWCIKLKDEVFDKEAFKKQAPDHFILVELDFPQRKELPEELVAQNQKLAEEYKVRGYPTIILLDPETGLYGRTGYQAGGAEAYLKHLEEMRSNKAVIVEGLATAEGAEGLDKARALDAVATARSENGLEAGDLADQIIALDPDNEAGLKVKYLAGNMLDEVEELANQGKFEEATAKVDELLALEISGEVKQKALFFKGALLYQQGDKEGGVAALELALEVNAESSLGKRIVKILEQVKAEAESEK